MYLRTLLLAAATSAVAACSSVDLNAPEAQGDAPRICNADQASHIGGQKITPQLEQQALQSSGAGMLRVIRPGQMVTRDYRSERLNLQLNDFDVVVRVYCG